MATYYTVWLFNAGLPGVKGLWTPPLKVVVSWWISIVRSISAYQRQQTVAVVSAILWLNGMTPRSSLIPCDTYISLLS